MKSILATLLLLSSVESLDVLQPWKAGAGKKSPMVDYFNGTMLQANGGKFWLGKPASAYCPSDVEHLDCTQYPGGQTVFVGGNGTVSLDVAVPGGQQVYVAPDGALSYTIPHSRFMPNGSVTTGFRKASGSGYIDEVLLTYDDGKFLACPNSTDIYQVYVQMPNTMAPMMCMTFSLRTYDVSFRTAWEY
ncbi:hypothetical protein GQ53DRAFT_850906 [Thozetella sp. PMI_491]|nr:hypothetical protein GQ53DRAFT_850906 [Thozetella sp. PMI_491]